MKKTLIKWILMMIIVVSVPSLAHSACFPSISLGVYSLGEWSNPDRTWVISDSVGNFNDRATSKSELQKHRNRLVKSCKTKGNALIAAAEEYFNKVKEGLGPEFDANCDQGDVCEEFRDLWIQSETSAIDKHVQKMKAWYKGNIRNCKRHFNNTYNNLVDNLCS